MNPTIWISGIFAIAISSMLAGAVLYAQLVPSKILEIPLITERVVKVETKTIEQPTIQIVEVPSVPAQTTVIAANGPNLVLPEDGKVPISRWVDPQNLNIIYTVPDGYNAIVVPMGMSVPDPWFQLLLNDYAMKHPEGLSNDFINWMPRDWLKVILPGELKYRLTENTNTLLPPNSNVIVP